MNQERLIEAKLCHSIHTSTRRSFRSCRRRWDLAHRQLWFPLTTPKPLEFGIAYHKAMECFYDPELWGQRDTSAQLALVEFNQCVKAQLKEYKRLNGDPTAEVLEDYRERVELGQKMIKFHTEKVSPELDKGLTPIATEVPFEVPLGLWCKCNLCWKKWIQKNCDTDRSSWSGLPVTYGGRIDAIFLDEDGRVFVVDWKTTSRILDEDVEASFLELDDQVSSYTVALWKQNRRVDGFIYHEQRKAVPEPPEELTRLYRGRKYSTNKNAHTDYNTFLKTVAANDLDALEAGCYDDYLTWLKTDGPKFFQRHLVLRTGTQLANAWRDMVEEAKDMINEPRIYPQPGRFSCPTCAYRQPCLGMNYGEDYKYTLRTLFEKRNIQYFETEPK